MRTETRFVTNKIHKDSTTDFSGRYFPTSLSKTENLRIIYRPPKKCYKLFSVFIFFVKIL